MAVLDNVLQAPPQTRQPHTGPRSDRNVEHESRDKTKGFEKALAKSGLKDEPTTLGDAVAEATASAADTAANATDGQSKVKASKAQPKMPQIKLMDLLSKDAKSALETVKQSLEGVKDATEQELPETGLEQKIQAFLGDEQIGKILTAKVTDAKSPLAELQGKLKDLAEKYIALIETAKSDVKSTDVAEENIAGTKLAVSEKPARSEKNERLDKLEKALKTALDKKSEAPAKGQIEPEDSANIQGMLDMLGNASAVVASMTAPAEPSGHQANDVADALAAISQGMLQPEAMPDLHGKDGPSKTNDTAKNPAAAMPESETDRVFHFSRADGTGKSIDLKIGGLKGPTSETDGAPTTQTKTENVVVLDARRYLALAPDSNAFNIVAQISGDKELSTALTSSIIDPDKAAATSKVVNTLKLQMNPLELGTVTATLRLRGEELSVSITVQNSHAYQQLSNDQDKMIEALRAQGFAVDQITVQLVSADRPAFQDQQQSSGQGQQQARDDAAAQQGRQQGNGSSRENPSQRNWQTFDNTQDLNTGNTSPDSSRNGQVYI